MLSLFTASNTKSHASTVEIPLKGVDEAMRLACPRPKTSMAGARRG